MTQLRIKLGILNPSDLSKGNVSGGSTGFVRNILPYLNVERIIIFGIGLNDTIPWKIHLLEPNAKFISICNLKSLSKIPMRLRVLLCYFRSRKKILNSGINLLYIQMPECCLPFLNNKKGIPVIYQKHGPANPVAKSKYIIGRTFFFKKFFEFALKLIYKKAQWIIAIDRHTLQQIIKYGGKNRSSLLMNAVDMKKFFPDRILRNNARKQFGLNEDDFAIIFVGRIEKTKGPESLLDCIPFLKERKCSFHIFFAGEGTYKPYLEKCAILKQYDADVTFLGHVVHEKLSYFYNMADVLVLPSETEGVPMVILEALACGTPVVASNVGSIHDIILNGINGIVIDDLHPEKLTKAIVEILSKKIENKVITKSVEPFNVNNFIKSFDTIISNIFKNRNKNY